MRLLALGLALSACTKHEIPAPPQPQRLVQLELVTGGASPDEDLPLIVALHGLGDTPDGFATIFDRFSAPARVVIPRARFPYEGGGFAWFAARTRDGDEERIARELDEATETIAHLLVELQELHGTRPVVTGFSQGGMLSFALAARHPDRVRAAVPIAGWLPSHLFPEKRPARAPVIRALHGTADPVVPFPLDRQTCDRLKALGFDVDLLPFEGLDHSISLELYRAWIEIMTSLAVP